MRCFAYVDSDGTIDLDSISEDEDQVRIKMLKASMGWEYEHPLRYSQDDQWGRLLQYGKVVPVVVKIQ